MGLSFNFDISVLLIFLVVYIELRSQRRRDLDQMRRERERSQLEVYQRLELASNDVHRFEADHIDLIRPLYTGVGAPTETAEQHAYYSYVNQILNLFELQVELYWNHIVNDDILATWVDWFNEVARAPGFLAVWEDGVRQQYSDRLVAVLDTASTAGDPLTLSDVVRIIAR
jgi:hypothetical protein